MKYIAKLCGLALMASLTANGAVYNVTTGTTTSSNGIASGEATSNPGGPALVGSFTGYQASGRVAFGIFSTDDAAITAATSLNTLVSAFVQFGADGSFNAAGPTGSKGVFTRNTSATVTGTSFSGQNIYVLAGNNSTFAGSTELLVLKLNVTFTDAQDSIPTAQLVSVNSSSATLLFGVNLADVRTTNADASVTAGWGTAAAVPEPSAALLGLVGVVGLLRRRR